ncbi:IRE (iron responsive element) [Crateriforma conspicua]|uniref:IRE (Iron responsive element) n=1 Tax=Crateriforma conspicua TaxID=2527996 RepID=A0A5C6FQN2_9PLAN|nr:IRE (iron responsive element) [Crateriforma conspicua]TWU62878.1 hypothetical protein V7x_46150 [Crateriforma conspicua]
MNLKSAFGRKILYLGVLVVMLVPLFLLGQPATGKGDRAGQLAEMRERFNIAESDLGEISPASETMKLASLGMRGVASTLLWNKAHDFSVRHEWDRLKATLNNIALLQPHFDRVWEFQAWNLAYNVSSEFDDYRQRYNMVGEGTDYLTRGVKQNRHASRLVWYTGWFYGQKLGMSDERKQFRELFADDEVWHEELLGEGIAVDSPEARGPMGKPDNWLVGRLWLNRGYDLVDSGVKIRRQTPINFYETGPKWRFKHAEAIEKEGVLDERAQNAWELASEDWGVLGNRSIPVTAPFTIKLDRIDELKRQRDEKDEQFIELVGDTTQTVRDELISKLSETERELLNRPLSEMTGDEFNLRRGAEFKTKPARADVARRTDPDVRLRAIRLAGEIDDLEARINKTEGYRKQINYQYWKTLAIAEQEERTVRARRLVYEAEKANADAELDKAIELYEESFAIWADIFDDYPILIIDDTAEDLRDSIRRYAIAIDSQEFDEDFPLKTFVEMMDEDGYMDPDLYEKVRETQAAKLEERQKEKEAEEKRLAEEAAKLEAAEKAKQQEEAESEESDSGSESESSGSEQMNQDEASEEPESEAAESDEPESSVEETDETGESSDSSDAETAPEESSTADESDAADESSN